MIRRENSLPRGAASEAAQVDCSVVMLAHNRERQLPASLEGLLHQRLGPFTFELVLVNDGSVDGTARIARAFRPSFPYQYLERENTNCRAAARNLGVRSARGEVILFLDADCVAPPDLVAAHVRRHLRQGQRAVAGGIRLLAELPTPRMVAEHPSHLYLLPQSQLPYLPRLVKDRAHTLITAHCSCRRSDLVAIGMFDEAFLGYGGEDMDVGVRLTRTGVTVEPAGEVVAFHQPHPPAPDRQSGYESATERLHQKHQRAWRILHRLEPPDDSSLARSVAACLQDRNLSQYRMEVAATGAAAEELRRHGIQPLDPQLASTLAAEVDLVHTHTRPGAPVPVSTAPTLYTFHLGEQGTADDGERTLPLLWKIQYDRLLCDARYPDMPDLLQPVDGEKPVLPDWLPSALKERIEAETLLLPSAAPLAPAPAAPVNFRAALGRPLRVRWEGHQNIAAGFARVNRELCRELLRAGDIELTLRWEDHPWGRLGAREEERLAHLFRLRNRPLSGPPDVTIRHQFPPDWKRPGFGRLVVFQPWEYEAVPAEWVREAHRADEIWACSRFVQQAFLASGIPADRVHLIPLGFDPEVFRQEGVRHPLPPVPGTRLRKGPPARTTFLFVGGATRRKGADLLLEAYLRAFTASDSVRLVVKDLGARSYYRKETLGAEFRRAALRPGAPEIVYLDADMGDAELAALYRAGDCLVQPYRGEGFALPPLEAMACGLPVLVTAGGPTDDYVDDHTGFRLPFRRAPAPDNAFVIYPCPPEVRQLEPDLEALTAALRWVYEHPEETRQRGVAAGEQALAHWTWRDSAAELRSRLLGLMGPERAPAPFRGAVHPAGAPPAAGPLALRTGSVPPGL